MSKPRIVFAVFALIAVAWGGYTLGVGVDGDGDLGRGHGKETEQRALDESGSSQEVDAIVIAKKREPLQAAEIKKQLLGAQQPPRIGGLVVDSEGGGVREALVELLVGVSPFLSRPQAGRALAGAVSDERGNFSFDDRVVPGARYLLRVKHPEYAWEWVPVVDSLQPASLNPRIVVSAGFPLRGTVRAEGRTVAGARVRVFDLEVPVRDFEDRVEAEAFSDEKGVYRFDHLRTGRKVVQASAAGCGPRSSDEVRVGSHLEARADINLGSGRLLRGRVIEAGSGRAIEGVEIVARPLRATSTHASPIGARTSSNGSFALEGVFAGDLVLEARHERYLEATTPSPGPGQEVVIELSPGAAISGVVTTAMGSLGPFVVSISPSQRQSSPFGRRWSFEAGDGSFEIPNCPPGNHYLIVQAPGYPSASAGPFRVGPGERRRGVRIELEQGALISGRVTATGGKGVGGARVTLLERRRFNDADPRIRALQAGSPPLRIAQGEVTTLADGSFILPGVREGEFRVRVEADGFASIESETVNVSGVADHGLADLRLWRASGLQGTVIASDGKFLPYSRVLIVPVDVVAAGQVKRQVVSDVEGQFRIRGLVPGVYLVLATRKLSLPPGAVGGDETTLVEGETKRVQLLAQ